MKKFLAYIILLCVSQVTFAQNVIVFPDSVYTKWPDWFIVDGGNAYIALEDGDTIAVPKGWQSRIHDLLFADEDYYDENHVWGVHVNEIKGIECFEPYVLTKFGWLNLNMCSRKMAFVMMVLRPKTGTRTSTKSMLAFLGKDTMPEYFPRTK